MTIHNLEATAAIDSLRGVDVVLLASASWNSPTRLNCHHIALRLAEHCRVLFVESTGMRSFSRGRDLPRLLRRLGDSIRGVRAVSPNLRVLSPLAVPIRAGAYSEGLNERLLQLQVARALGSLEMHPAVVWVFNPLMHAAVPDGDAFRVYHCVDNYAGNALSKPGLVADYESRTLANANLVFATANTLFERLTAMHTDVVLMENVADVEHFRTALDPATPLPEDVCELSGPIIGYTGNLDANKVDLALLSAVATARPDWSFLLIGPHGLGNPGTDLALLQDRPNVRLLGPRPYAELPAYLKAMDVCLIPFQLNPMTEGSLPLKFFEYLAAGRPVVATPLPTLTPYAGLYYEAATPGAFVEAIERALAEGVTSEAQERRSEAAASHSWQVRFSQMEAEIVQRMSISSPVLLSTERSAA